MTSEVEVGPVISLASYRAAQVAAEALPHILTMDRRPPDCLLAVRVEVVEGEPVVVALVTDIDTLPVTLPKRIGTGGGHYVTVVLRGAQNPSMQSEE